MAITLLVNGSFETGRDQWTLTAPNGVEASFTEDAARARTGDWSLNLRAFRLFIGDPFDLGTAQSATLSYWPNKEHTLTLWARSASGDARMRARAFEDVATLLATTGNITITSSDYQQVTLTFTPTIAAGYILLEARSNGSTNHSLDIDDVSVTLPEVTPMAYIGPELAVAAMIDLIQDNLAAELAKIVLERNDSLAFPATVPDAVFNRPLDAFTGSTLQLEVFSSESVFPVSEADLSTWYASVPRVTTDVALTVRLRIANRGTTALSPVDFSKMTNRYAAALLRLVRNDTQLANGGSALVDWAKPESLRISRSDTVIDEDVTQYMDVVEIDFLVSLTETNANENISGGGTVPAFSGGHGLT